MKRLLTLTAVLLPLAPAAQAASVEWSDIRDGLDAWLAGTVALQSKAVHHLALDNDAFEVDALATTRGAQRSLLGVNMAERVQEVSLVLDSCPGGQLELFGPDNQSRRSDFACEQGKIRFQLPGQTLFALTWSES